MNSYPAAHPTPAMLAAYQQQQQQQKFAPGGLRNMNPMFDSASASINPALLSSPAMSTMVRTSSSSSPTSQQFSQQQLAHLQQQQLSQLSPQQQAQLAASVGISSSQMASMSPQQMGILLHKVQQQQQQHASQGASAVSPNPLDRPSSSGSTHSATGQQGMMMMPPPPPRPSTAMGMSMNMMPSRPGTSLSHRSPVIPGPTTGITASPDQQHQMGMNLTPLAVRMQQQQQQQQHQQQQFNAMANMAAMNGMDTQQLQRMQTQMMMQQQQQQQQQMQMQQQQQMQMQQQQAQQMARPPSRVGMQQMNNAASTPRPGTPSSQAQRSVHNTPKVHSQQLSSHSQTQSPVVGSIVGLPHGGGSAPPTPSANGMNASSPTHGQQAQLQHLNMNFSGAGGSHHGSPPVTPVVQGMQQQTVPPGSPYRGAKRKLGSESAESPRLGGAVPSALSASGSMNGGAPGGMHLQPQQQQQALMMQRQRVATGSPRPVSSMGMSGMDPMGLGMTPQLQQQQLQQQYQQQQLQQQQQQQQQMMQAQAQAQRRQGSMPPPAAGAIIPGARQGSLPPPTTSSPMKMGVVSGGAPVPGLGGQVSAPAIMPVSSSSSQISGGVSMSIVGPQFPGVPAVVPALPPLPANVSLNSAVTKVTPVPLVDSLKLIPELTPEEIEDVKSWMETDKAYDVNVFRKMRERMGEEVKEAFGVGGGKNGGSGSVCWWEKGFAGKNLNKWRALAYNNPHLMRGRGPGGVLEPFDVRYPPRMRPVGEAGAMVGVISSSRGRKGVRREGLKVPRRLKAEYADRPEQLVAIRLEFDVEHQRMRDTFVWNINDPLVTPDAFAQSIVEDYALPGTYHSFIVKAIQDQLSDYRSHSFQFDGAEAGVIDLTNGATNPSTNGNANGEGNAPEDSSMGEGEYNHAKQPGERIEVEVEDVLLKGKLEEEDTMWWDAWKGRVRAMELLASGKRGRRTLVKQRLNAGIVRRPRMSKGRLARKDEDDEESAMEIANNTNDDEGDGDDEDDEEEEEKEEDGDDDGWLLPPLPGEGKENRALALHEIPLNEATMHEEIRILIKLDIIVGSMKLDDQFEWDMESTDVMPEEFAEVYTKDLGLNGEFKTAIAHSIREQVQTYQKSLFLVGHPLDGTAVQDDELRQSFLPSLVSGARPVGDVSMFTPTLNYLSDGEIERTEKDLNKRRKRNTRGRRGIALPDREPIRTYRTPAIGFPELDPATLALAAAANAPVSRRAAAAAASLTIANMVASENGTVFMPQSMPSNAQPTPQNVPQKEKKVKGLFKAPAVPPGVLRARAHVVAPTPSTGVVDVSALPAPLEDDPPRVMPAPQMVFDRNGLGSAGGASGSGTNAAMHKMLTMKRTKEREREAKEKEFVDGQHPNYIEGVWHCSNCGCPENIAVGRRKGPLGDKSQCGTCGKFWHRHRRPRPVEYNPDPEFHSGVLRKEAEAKTPAGKRKGKAAAKDVVAAVAASSLASGLADWTPETQTPRKNGTSTGAPSRQSPELTPRKEDDDDDERGLSPVSTASSTSEAPLAQKMKMNGTPHKKEAREEERKREREKASAATPPNPNPPVKSEAPSSSSSAAPASSPQKVWPPEWLTNAMHAMQKKYPNDKFDVILRKTTASMPEWRIKCLDCPGKLYTPGPNESLTNYEVHLKNRQHRQRVNDRLGVANSHPGSSGSTSNSGSGVAGNVNAPLTAASKARQSSPSTS